MYNKPGGNVYVMRVFSHMVIPANAGISFIVIRRFLLPRE